MRSGLVFAGVNRVLDGGSAPDSPHDGIINALDVAGLPLHGTRIVVLSCCFSGRGDVENGEGVAGLRRSFIIAGAQAVVCSLWAVPDRAPQRSSKLTRGCSAKLTHRLSSYRSTCSICPE